MRRKRAEMMRESLRIVLEKVRRRGLYCLPSARIVVFFSLFLILFCDLNM